jgi:hypothetical protein
MRNFSFDERNGIFELYFNRAFYKIEALKEGMDAIYEYGSVELVDSAGDKYFKLRIKLHDNESCSEDLIYDFCNYVLASMKNKSLV